MPLNFLEILPHKNVERTIVWMHGLGADGHDFEPVARELLPQLTKATRFLLPHAPSLPVSINGGMVMPAWYDITHTDLGKEPDKGGVEKSAKTILDFCLREAKGTELVLAGFSQGGAMALHTAFCMEKLPTGILCLSGYLPDEGVLPAEPTEQNPSIMMMHGSFDPVVAPDLAKKSREKICRWGFEVSWKEYPMPHSVCPEEIRDIADWLNSF